MPTRKADSRFTVVVSSKVARSAAKRNRIKRLIREALAQHLRHIKRGFDCVVVATNAIRVENVADANALLTGLLRNASVLTP